MDDERDVEALFEEIDDAVASTSQVVQAFGRELRATERSIGDTQEAVRGLDRSMGRNLRGAFDALIFDGERASDALRGMMQGLSNSVLNSALKPVQDAVGGGISGLVTKGIGSLLPFEKGGVMASGRVRAFAKGGVVTGPQTFPMRGGRTGLMGEAGPEAIMPLTRGADGSLGVRAEGGGGGSVHVTMNISTPDAESFRRSKAQVAAEMNRALARGKRNM